MPPAALTAGQSLAAGQELVSPNGTYQLIMQGDGNLVLYSGAVTCSTACSGDSLWDSGTNGDNGASATMQSDGNLVIYDNGKAVWSSITNGFAGSYLKLQDDSNLVIYQGSDPIWDRGSGYMGDQLLPGETLSPGEELMSPGRQYSLIMQGDGNLVLYSGAVTCSTSCSGTSLWNSGTEGDDGASVTMQSDGNLVIYPENSSSAAWASGTDGFPGAYLKLQDDNNLVVYQGSDPIWDRGAGYMGDSLYGNETLTPGEKLLSPNHQYSLIMQGDGNLVLYQGAVSCSTACSGDSLWQSVTSGDDGSTAVMQGDGNLVVYDAGVAKWNSATSGNSGAYLRVQDDGNLVVYEGSTAIWDRGSGNLVGGTSGSGGGGNLGATIVSIAESEDQHGKAISNSPATTADGGCNPFTGYWGDGSASGCPAGSRNNAWCADFAAWVWRQANVSFTYGGGSTDINAWSASFYQWGEATGNWHPVGDGYAPQPGDVAVYGNLTEQSGPGHVGIYASGSASSPTVVNGNWATSWPNPNNYGVIIQSGESNTGVSGGTLDGYVSP